VFPFGGILADWIGGLSSVKSQAPNPKLQRPPNVQIPNQLPTGWELVWDLDVGSVLGFGIWSLGFGEEYPCASVRRACSDRPLRRGGGSQRGWLSRDSLVSCHVTLNVLKSDPRRVVAPVLYTNLRDCREEIGTDTVAPSRLLR
jgi:hypothetical protein